MDILLEIRDLTVEIQTDLGIIRPVDGVDLTIRAKEMLALVGESGCGKTTLALSVGQLFPQRVRIVSGSIRFDTTDLLRLSQKALRSFLGKQVAYLFQDPFMALNPVLSIEEQLCEVIGFHRGVTKAQARHLAEALLDQVRISHPKERLRQYPHQLSGGMRQRVALAMALAGEPRLLIADEPTSALDVTTQAELLQLLDAVRRRHGMAVWIITHDLIGVARHADRIAVMYLGRIVETSSTQTFFHNPSHPYAQALMACIPKLRGGTKAFHPIPGTLPDLRMVPQGCSFHPRCGEVMDRCRKELPPIRPIGKGHEVRCWARMP